MKVKLKALNKNYLVEFKSNDEFVSFVTKHNDQIKSLEVINENTLPSLEKPVEMVKISEPTGWVTLEKSAFKNATKETNVEKKGMTLGGKYGEFKYEPGKNLDSSTTDKVSDTETESPAMKGEEPKTTNVKNNEKPKFSQPKKETPKETSEEETEEKKEVKESVEDNEFERHEMCVWCGEEFPKSELRKEKDMGYICHRCIKGIESREGNLEWEDDELKESVLNENSQQYRIGYDVGSDYYIYDAKTKKIVASGYESREEAQEGIYELSNSESNDQVNEGFKDTMKKAGKYAKGALAGAAMMGALAGGNANATEIHNSLPDGAHRPFENVDTVNYDGHYYDYEQVLRDGEPIHVNGYTYTVEDLKQTQKDNGLSNEQMDELINGGDPFGEGNQVEQTDELNNVDPLNDGRHIKESFRDPIVIRHGIVDENEIANSNMIDVQVGDVFLDDDGNELKVDNIGDKEYEDNMGGKSKLVKMTNSAGESIQMPQSIVGKNFKKKM